MNFRIINMELDRDIIIKFREDTYFISFGTMEGFDEVSYIERIRERVNEFPDGQLIIEDQHKAIGQIGLFTQKYQDREIGYVNLYYLIKEYRNKGIGKELVNYSENYFRRLHMSEYHLRVSSENKRAIALYTSLGMTKLEEEKNGQHLLWRMRKLL